VAQRAPADPADLAESALPQLPCLCASLRRAARAVTQLYERELRDSGLTGPQFSLLQAIGKTGPVTQGRLGRLLALDSTTLSRTLRPLESHGWIRCETGRDRRERSLDLTKTGKALVRKLVPAWDRVQRRLEARMGAERWEMLLSELSTVAGVAQDF
jgi:DNA-binding MarR family transcriptional regulator